MTVFRLIFSAVGAKHSGSPFNIFSNNLSTGMLRPYNIVSNNLSAVMLQGEAFR
jgi:hypothetical protein